MGTDQTAMQNLQGRLRDRESQLSELRSSRAAETERVKPLPNTAGLVAGVTLIVVGVLIAVGPIGLLTLSPPDVRDGFLTICGLSPEQLAQINPTSPGTALAQTLIGIFAICLPTFAAILGGGAFLTVRASRDRRAIAAINAEAAQHISAIDSKISEVLRNVEETRQKTVTGDTKN